MKDIKKDVCVDDKELMETKKKEPAGRVYYVDGNPVIYAERNRSKKTICNICKEAIAIGQTMTVHDLTCISVNPRMEYHHSSCYLDNVKFMVDLDRQEELEIAAIKKLIATGEIRPVLSGSRIDSNSSME